MIDLGVRLQLLVGPTVPLPASYDLADALRTVEVRNNDRERDGFQLEFSLGKNTLLDYGLLSTPILEPPSRVILVAIIQAIPLVLIDGVITDHQVTPSNQPGSSTLRVSGVDVSIMMDLEEKNATYPNQSDSAIVTRLLGSYARFGIVPEVFPTTYVPVETQRVTNQQGTDYAFIRELARRNGYIFYVEPTNLPGSSRAYWGPDARVGLPQPALAMNMGPATNVDTPMYFRYDALGPAQPTITIIEPSSGVALQVPAPPVSAAPMASRPTTALRHTITRDTASLSPAEAAPRALAEVSEGSDAVTASGQVDAVRYGTVLRARRIVGVAGVGFNFDGNYYVRQVTHRIRRGEYKQDFALAREGRGALTPVVAR